MVSAYHMVSTDFVSVSRTSHNKIALWNFTHNTFIYSQCLKSNKCTHSEIAHISAINNEKGQGSSKSFKIISYEVQTNLRAFEQITHCLKAFYVLIEQNLMFVWYTVIDMFLSKWSYMSIVLMSIFVYQVIGFPDTLHFLTFRLTINMQICIHIYIYVHPHLQIPSTLWETILILY